MARDPRAGRPGRGRARWRHRPRRARTVRHPTRAAHRRDAGAPAFRHHGAHARRGRAGRHGAGRHAGSALYCRPPPLPRRPGLTRELPTRRKKQEESMDIRKLQRAIVDGLEDVKAQDIQVFNTEHLSPLFERVIVAAGASNRQTKALAASVRDAVKSAGMDVLRTEGEENGEWIIVDCGAAVAHIMQPSTRAYSRLEEIWGGKPVAIKLNTKSGGLVKASEGGDDDEGGGKPT